MTVPRYVEAWTAHKIAPGSMGGTGPDGLNVHLCPACHLAHSDPFPSDCGPLAGALLAYVPPTAGCAVAAPRTQNCAGYADG
ncbi:hypothetical protein [Leifsonia sp. RAF41]|uniref:hypothetical protein n=1 Tax=Leifsonia sp. RAF41 TaxID=3233056 RepID=UPI003F9C22B7